MSGQHQHDETEFIERVTTCIPELQQTADDGGNIVFTVPTDHVSNLPSLISLLVRETKEGVVQVTKSM